MAERVCVPAAETERGGRCDPRRCSSRRAKEAKTHACQPATAEGQSVVPRLRSRIGPCKADSHFHHHRCAYRGLSAAVGISFFASFHHTVILLPRNDFRLTTPSSIIDRLHRCFSSWRSFGFSILFSHTDLSDQSGWVFVTESVRSLSSIADHITRPLWPSRKRQAPRRRAPPLSRLPPKALPPKAVSQRQIGGKASRRPKRVYQT